MVRYLKFAFLALALLQVPSWAVDVDTAGLPNFHQVNVRVYRGGQPADAGFRTLAGLGVKTVIDLRRTDEHPTLSEEHTVEALGMRYINIPMSGTAAPPASDVLRVLGLLDTGAEGPVFVHCRRGADRTGTVIACYRIWHDGWSNDKALQEARSLGMNWIELGMKHYIMNFKTHGCHDSRCLADGSASPAHTGQ